MSRPVIHYTSSEKSLTPHVLWVSSLLILFNCGEHLIGCHLLKEINQRAIDTVCSPAFGASFSFKRIAYFTVSN